MDVWMRWVCGCVGRVAVCVDAWMWEEDDWTEWMVGSGSTSQVWQHWGPTVVDVSYRDSYRSPAVGAGSSS